MSFFNLPPEPGSKPRSRKKKVAKRATASRKKATGKARSRPKKTTPEIPRKKPKRVLVKPKAFEKILAAGDWPAGPNRKPFKHQGKTYKPWIVLQYVVTALGPAGEVVEFVEDGSPLA